jgi:hypothetical protein
MANNRPTVPATTEPATRPDRLELYTLSRDQERHLHQLFGTLDAGRAEVANSVPIMAKAAKRLATTLEELAELFNADPQS